MTLRSHLFGVGGVAFVTDNTGKTILVPGVPITTSIPTQPLDAALYTDSETFSAPTITLRLVAALHTDDETFHAPTVVLVPLDIIVPALVTDADTFSAPAVTSRATLQPALFDDADAIYAATLVIQQIARPGVVTDADSFSSPTVVPGSVTVFPVGRHNDQDTVFLPFATLVGLGGGPQQKLKPPPKIQDNDVFFSPSLSKHTGIVIDVDTIRAPVVTSTAAIELGLLTDADSIPAVSVAAFNRLQPALVANDDAILAADLVVVLQPALLDSDDEVGAADVGWQVIAEFTEDVDEAFEPGWTFFNELLPEVWSDGDTIDTYPFFLQQLTGGVPVPPREGVLKGSITDKRVLKGSIAARRRAA